MSTAGTVLLLRNTVRAGGLQCSYKPALLRGVLSRSVWLVVAACLGAALVGFSDLLANCAPTAPSKKPFEAPASHMLKQSQLRGDPVNTSQEICLQDTRVPTAPPISVCCRVVSVRSKQEADQPCTQKRSQSILRLYCLKDERLKDEHLKDEHLKDEHLKDEHLKFQFSTRRTGIAMLQNWAETLRYSVQCSFQTCFH